MQHKNTYSIKKRGSTLCCLLASFMLLNAQADKGKKDSFVIHNGLVPEQILQPPDSTITISLNFIGDLMCHKPQTTNAKQKDGTYDFKLSFQYIKKYLSDADFTMGNLETTLAGSGKPYAGYPAFNSPDEYIAAVKDAGVDFLGTANNHSMDTGEDGLLRTISVLKKNGIPYAGTYCSQSDHDSLRIVNIKGLKMAVLDYTYGTNGSYPKADHKYMLNVIDSSSIVNEIRKTKEAGADIVLVFYHFGVENKAEPVQAQKDAVRYAWQAGANLIIGAHPHVVGPVNKFAPYGDNKDSTFVAYSLGNFISNQYWRYTDAGVILNLKVTKNLTKNSVTIDKAEMLPTWVYRAENPELKAHIVLPAQLYEVPDFLPSVITDSMKVKMKEAFEDTKSMINKYGAFVEVKDL